MQKIKHYTFLFLTFFLFFSIKIFPQNFDKTDWKLKTTKDNLKVYTRKNENSDVKEIRVKTIIHASLEKVMAVLNDVSNYDTWVFKCIEAKKVKINSKNDYYYYSIYDFPFPIQDRDILIHTKQWKDKTTGDIYSNSKASAKKLVDAKKGVVRITILDSYWKITPNDDGSISIDYIALTHPGGKLPAWVINLGITRGPLVSLKKFKKLVEEKSNNIEN